MIGQSIRDCIYVYGQRHKVINEDAFRQMAIDIIAELYRIFVVQAYCRLILSLDLFWRLL